MTVIYPDRPDVPLCEKAAAAAYLWATGGDGHIDPALIDGYHPWCIGHEGAFRRYLVMGREPYPYTPEDDRPLPEWARRRAA